MKRVFVFFSSENTSVSVLFIGMPGSGKSSTINILLGKNECKSGSTFDTKGITREIKSYKLEFQLESKIEIGKNPFPFTHKANWTQCYCIIFCFRMQDYYLWIPCRYLKKHYILVFRFIDFLK